MKANQTRSQTPRSKGRSAGFSLVEVTVSMAIVGTAAIAIFAGINSGFFTMQMARENLRATQIMLEKMETLRLYSWDQVNTPGFITPTFTAAYDPNTTNQTSSINYRGSVTVGSINLPTSYSNDMKQVTVTVSWSTGNLPRTRSFTTYIARNGLQNYIY